MQNKLKSYRALHGLTQLDMACNLGISVTNYKLKEEGRTDFKVSEIKKIQKFFNISSEEIGKMFFEIA
ncbi:MAG: helix-turn-helix domain-containing protein [archaeon]|nr:helix-turn-helix domain-containing protein [archaeon]